MGRDTPLILVSNDDGISSPGLAALVEAMHPLGEVIVVAPREPYSSSGRSFLRGSREIEPRPWPLAGVTAYAVDAAPALVVRVGLEVLAPRPPALVVSGVNQGENVGSDVTMSGTVGAAIEAAVSEIPSLAFSLEAPPQEQDEPRGALDFTVAAAFARRLAAGVLRWGLPAGVDLLKVDVPAGAGPHTPWATTRISRRRYWHAIVVDRPGGEKEIAGYERRVDCPTHEPDSDVHALVCRRIISVSPMTVDLTAPLDLGQLAAALSRLCPAVPPP